MIDFQCQNEVKRSTFFASAQEKFGDFRCVRCGENSSNDGTAGIDVGLASCHLWDRDVMICLGEEVI